LNGKNASTRGDVHWENKMTALERHPALGAFLKEVFDRYSYCKPEDGAVYERRLYDFQFHMTDWLNDLMPFAGAIFRPETPPKPEMLSAIFSFLNHAMPHLVGAREALDGEVFEHTFPAPQAAPGEHGPVAKRAAPRRKVKI
jgi:hypothetical protein